MTTTSGTTLWDISDPAAPRDLTRLPATATRRAFSPDGRRLVTTRSNEVQVWDVRDPAKPTEIARWPAHRGAVTTLRFSDDGTRLLTAGDSSDKDLALFDMTVLPKVEVRARFAGHTGGVADASFTSPNEALVSVGEDGRVIRWDLKSWGRPVAVANGVSGGPAIESAAFTADGRILATGGRGHDVTLWDMAEPRQPKKLAVIPGDRFVWGVAFSRDGRTLAIGYARAGVSLYDVEGPAHPKPAAESEETRRCRLPQIVADPRAMACAAAGGGFTREEWKKFVPDLPFEETCTP
ncbi:hypothetical protein [Streptomyces sp. NPDC048269]|uniref:WD40 repeat domain-containing protein n=1 Tax=Streptomyces sp. NPDC048269 TaxID=3155753 RepID=UPI00341FB9DE